MICDPSRSLLLQHEIISWSIELGSRLRVCTRQTRSGVWRLLVLARVFTNTLLWPSRAGRAVCPDRWMNVADGLIEGPRWCFRSGAGGWSPHVTGTIVGMLLSEPTREIV